MPIRVTRMNLTSRPKESTVSYEATPWHGANAPTRGTDMADVVLNPQLSLTAIAKRVTMRLLTKRHRRMRPHQKMIRRDSRTESENALFVQCSARDIFARDCNPFFCAGIG